MTDEKKRLSLLVKITIIIIALAAVGAIIDAFSKDENKNNMQTNISTAAPTPPPVPQGEPLTAKGKIIKQKHKSWTNEDCNIIAKGEIAIGMDADQVIAAWGKPYQVNKTTTGTSTHEQWVMHQHGSTYLYFDNGILRTIQQSR